MKIDELIISNFRGIQRLETGELGDTIIIAGQNGSGKSCAFDAIRLLKSTYGGYQQNEWQQFFGEFAIQLHGGAQHLAGLFNDPSKPVQLEATFRLRDEERAYATANASELLEETIWQSVLPEAFQYGGYRKAMFAAQFRDREPEVKARLALELPSFLAELQAPATVASAIIQPSGQVTLAPSILLSVLFTCYRPRKIGVMDFHGAQRHYGRENVQGINLNLDQLNQTQSAHSLYNYNNKYQNVKSEMAANFIKELLAERASSTDDVEGSSLISTLRELFEAFFPDKEFLGPQPTANGGLSFPVKTHNGNVHDLDELSSGEKEILYGYLRIRSSAPSNSIILLDEPELHLNPRLIKGLPEFYRKHLGEALQNQLWLVTHSDALIREAVGKPGFNVFHMLPCGADGAETSQLRPLSVTADLDLVVADLVGDLAAYRPGGKGLIFEGGGGSDFDKAMAATLFPEELRGVNLISGTNKTRVKSLHEVLENAYLKGDLPTKFYAIMDKDSDQVPQSGAVNRFEWDVYHIENYLLNDDYLAEVLNTLVTSAPYVPSVVGDRLNEAARKVVPGVLIHKMRAHANSLLVRSIELGFPPDTLTVGREVHLAAARSTARVAALMDRDLSESALVNVEQLFRTEIEQSFGDGTWRQNLPGRDILKQFVALESLPVGYEVLRNLVLSRMAEKGFQPPGMKVVIDKVVAD
jgi:predicted ATPase